MKNLLVLLVLLGACAPQSVQLLGAGDYVVIVTKRGKETRYECVETHEERPQVNLYDCKEVKKAPR